MKVRPSFSERNCNLRVSTYNTPSSLLSIKQEKLPASMASSSSIPCGYCQKRFRSSAELRRHHAERPMFCSKYDHCTTEHGCYMCGGMGEHRRKAAGKPMLNHQCKFCNTEFISSAELHRHHTQKPIFCATRNSCTTEHGCYLCGGEGVHYRKDDREKWTFDAYHDVAWCPTEFPDWDRFSM